MTKVAIQGHANGTGTFTVSAPQSNNNRSFSLPDTDGTLATAEQMIGMRNKIINGDMSIAQRGTSFAAMATGTFVTDRFAYLFAGTTAVATGSQQADAPNDEFQYSARVAVTTADAAVAAGDIAYLIHRVEGYNARDLIGRTFTLSFNVRSSKTGTHCVAFRNNGGTTDRSYLTEYTVTAANTWEKKTITVPSGLITAGTWNWTNGIGLELVFCLMAGSTFQAAKDQWNVGNFIATSNQVNCMDTVGNIFAITGVQVEIGTTATAFEHRSQALELSLCQRYYEQVEFPGMFISAGSATQFNIPMWFKTSKRSIPTITLPAATNKGYTTGGAALTPATTWTTVNPSVESFSLVAAHSAAFGGVAVVSIPCNSEL